MAKQTDKEAAEFSRIFTAAHTVAHDHLTKLIKQHLRGAISMDEDLLIKAVMGGTAAALVEIIIKFFEPPTDTELRRMVDITIAPIIQNAVDQKAVTQKMGAALQ